MSDWYYLIDNEQKGPISEPALKELFSAQQLPAETFVWKEGMEGWVGASQIPGFLPSAEPASADSEPTAPAQVDISPVAEEKIPEAAQACAQCKSAPIVPGYPTPLCQPCRDGFIYKAVPIWLRIAAGALVVLMLASAIRIPRELTVAIAYDRGQTAEQNGDYATAAKAYQSALLSYPKSVDILSSLARAAHRSGDQATAIQCVNQIIAQTGPSGDISKDTVDIINEVKGANP